ncbi:cell envelope biogenesis protein TonB [Bacteroidales bacterium]|nr:cell envelope biogenesis protein TonB [Bacteroidales bacterium]
MARGIDLTSAAWVDLIFEGKNKKYGAYVLREESSKRHMAAMIIVIFVVVLAVLLPLLISAVVPERDEKIIEIGPVELSNLDAKDQVKEENIIAKLEVPPPPVLNASIKFTPPVIKKDEEVADDSQIATQDELTDTRVAISVATVEGVMDGSGVDIATLEDNKVVVAAPVVKDEIFNHVEQMPTFPGGEREMLKFLSDNMKYPVIAQEQGISGSVILRFVVGTDGSVKDVTIQRSLDPSCDKEAVRVVRSMPKWVPGKQNGRPVLVYFTLPVRFRLAN